MNSTDQQEPQASVELDSCRVTILGTAHVSRASAQKVTELLASGEFDAVAVELCPSRYKAITDPNHLAKMDLFEVVRSGKASMVAASLALSAYQQRLAEQLGIEPGAEMRAALDSARTSKLPVLLLDREIGITLKRIYRKTSWWNRLYLLAGLIASVVTREKVSEEEIEQLKQGDILETTFTQFADQQRDLFVPLIKERDQYMGIRLLDEIAQNDHRHILAVVGAGHLQGIKACLQQNQGMSNQQLATIIASLDHIPAPSLWPRLIPWLIVILILLGFVIGFSRNTTLGWQLVADWVLINGSLAALGALIAAAHPITIIGAFVAAPITSLNPAIGAGVVTTAIEIFLRKPRVGDFSRLRSDTTNIKGWWRNRVARTLLVFLFTTLGSALGTYIAGFRIFGRLSG